jgi:hypothetical protein
MLGSADEGIAEIVAGLAAASATGAHMEDPYFLALLADAHLEAGFSDEEIRMMAVENTRRLAGA